MRALDLFAGTGWGVACQQLEIEEMGVEIMPAAIETRTANGMATPWFDVWETLKPSAEIPAYDVLIASPPCQTFSRAGKGTGRAALDEVREAMYSGIWDNPEELREFGERHDERTALVLTPMTQVMRDEPSVVILEQVPPVLPVWEIYAEFLAGGGYSVVTGLLHSEQYGVPQTRQRAILIARKEGVAVLPSPTHSRYYSRTPEKLDPGVRPWVSMAAALGWGMTRRPYPTVATGTAAGGTDPAALGGSGARRLVYAERASGDWAPSGDLDNDGGILRLTIEEASALQSYPSAFDFEWALGAAAAVAARVNDQSGGPYDKDWPLKRPATTVAGRDIIGNPGANANRENGRVKSRNDGIHVTPEEASMLQSYPEGFQWRGNRSAIFQQIGNAVPPLMAKAVLEAATA